MKICNPILIGALLVWSTAFVAEAAFSTLPARAVDAPGFVYTPSPADWRDIPIYQVITDRFFDGDSANNDDNPYGNTDPANPTSIHGGDFEGLAAKLDYIQMLGMRAIWISPVVRNVNGEFHGFAATDFNAIDPHWGTLADLRALIDAAHARGIYVIIDVVQNHCGDRITSNDSGWPSYAPDGYTLRWINTARKHAPPFDVLNRFYNHGQIDNFGDAGQSLKGDFFSLDGINTELPAVRQDMVTIYQALIAATDCDGFRVDTARHVEMEFWETFLPALKSFTASIGKTNFLVTAEAWLASDTDLAPFTASNRFNSVLHFPLRDTIEGVVVWGQPTANLSARLNNLSLYAPPAREQLVRFVDNHDMPRLLSGEKLAGNRALASVALSFLFTAGGVPALYYGTEQGFDGGGDPYDREDMFDGQFEYGPSTGDNFNFTASLFRQVRQLNLVRQAYPVLARGNFTSRWETTSGRGLHVYSRQLGGAEAVVAINTASQAQTVGAGDPGPLTAQSNGTVLANLLNPAETVVVGQGGGNGRIAFTVPAYGTKIWMRQADLVPFPPTLNAILPAHDATDTARGEKILLTFDQSMDLATVESAFSITPPISGTFVWDSPRQMNFVPNSLLAANTRYTVRVRGSAQTAGGINLGVAFESFFTTGTKLVFLPEVALRQFQLDGAISGDETGARRAAANGVSLYADFNGRELYFATPAAGNGTDRFVLVTTNLSGSFAAPWAKSGQVAGLERYIGNEADNGWSGWFHNAGGSGGQTTAVAGGWLEGRLDPLTAYGRIPAQLYLASVPYQTSNGGALDGAGQCPPGDGDGNVEASEYFSFNLAALDNDGDGLPDLQEDANANGQFDPGETHPLVADTDGDGMNDGAEYQAGTNPNSAASIFVSAIEHVRATGQVRLRWTGLAGHVYTVWQASDLAGTAPRWTVTAMQNVSGTGGPMQYSEPVFTAAPARLFRVQVRRQ